MAGEADGAVEAVKDAAISAIQEAAYAAWLEAEGGFNPGQDSIFTNNISDGIDEFNNIVESEFPNVSASQYTSAIREAVFDVPRNPDILDLAFGDTFDAATQAVQDAIDEGQAELATAETAATALGGFLIDLSDAAILLQDAIWGMQDAADAGDPAGYSDYANQAKDAQVDMGNARRGVQAEADTINDAYRTVARRATAEDTLAALRGAAGRSALAEAEGLSTEARAIQGELSSMRSLRTADIARGVAESSALDDLKKWSGVGEGLLGARSFAGGMTLIEGLGTLGEGFGLFWRALFFL